MSTCSDRLAGIPGGVRRPLHRAPSQAPRRTGPRLMIIAWRKEGRTRKLSRGLVVRVSGGAVLSGVRHACRARSHAAQPGRRDEGAAARGAPEGQHRRAEPRVLGPDARGRSGRPCEESHCRNASRSRQPVPASPRSRLRGQRIQRGARARPARRRRRSTAAPGCCAIPASPLSASLMRIARSITPRRPRSPSTRLGRCSRRLASCPMRDAQYLRAAQLDPAASYPVMNLCHVDTMLGRRDAVASCVHALNLEPGSVVAHNNLALAYAVAGDFPRAHAEFAAAGGGPATASYNMGVVYMAARQFERATSAFQAARRCRSALPAGGQAPETARRDATAIGLSMSQTQTEVSASPLAAPRTLEETGLPWEVVHQLVTKTLLVAGELRGSDLATRLGVVFSVIEPSLDVLKRERLCEIFGGALGPQSYIYRLTANGQARASAYMEHNQYVGQLPVPLAQYTAYMKSVGSRQGMNVGRAAVRKAYSHLVMNSRVLDQLGPAIAARHSLFIYGPPGNGKTVIAQAIGRLMTGELAIPQRHLARHRNHAPVRSAESSADRRRGGGRPGAGYLVGPSLGAVPPAHRHRRWRADAGRPRPRLQPDVGLLQRAAAGAGQRRRARHRRLRPPARLPTRAAEPLDRAARKPHRPSEPQDRTEVRAAVRGAGRVRDEPEPDRSASTRRSCAGSSTRCTPSRRPRRSSRRSSRTTAATRIWRSIRRWSNT